MTPRPLSKQVEILLVEDSPADVLITREALSEVRLVCTIHVARDGAEATEFLHKAGRFTAAPQPDLILLDLNMPPIRHFWFSTVALPMRSQP
jgi:two-component system response regulator